jgi:hypothetical protein
VFSQWISGQPWWLTVLMLLACLGFVLKQVGLALLILLGVAAVGALAWRLRRRPQPPVVEPDSTLP